MRQKKGLVGIEADRGWLRLRMPRNFSQRYIYLNLFDSPKNRAIAQKIADDKNRELQQAQLKRLNF